MQMYVNYYTREMMNEGDNKPIGIVLCADKSEQVVKYTLPEGNNQIFASKYKIYLPTEEELKNELYLKVLQQIDGCNEDLITGVTYSVVKENNLTRLDCFIECEVDLV